MQKSWAYPQGSKVHWILFWSKEFGSRKLSNFLRYVLEYYVFRVPVVKQDLFDKINLLLKLVFQHIISAMCTSMAIRFVFRLRGLKDSQQMYWAAHSLDSNKCWPMRESLSGSNWVLLFALHFLFGWVLVGWDRCVPCSWVRVVFCLIAFGTCCLMRSWSLWIVRLTINLQNCSSLYITYRIT